MSYRTGTSCTSWLIDNGEAGRGTDRVLGTAVCGRMPQGHSGGTSRGPHFRMEVQ